MRCHSFPALPTLAMLAALAVLPSFAGAQVQTATAPGAVPRADSLFSTDYLLQLWHDTTATLSGPTRWGESDWGVAGVWTAATLTAAAFDHDIRRQAQSHWRTKNANRFFKDYEQLGAGYSFAVIGAFEAWGVTTDNRNAQDTAMDAVTSTVIASGIVTPALKYAVGRYRPSETSRTFRFRSFSGKQSFPSGHVTQAFAVATVIAEHYPGWWQQTLSYGAASLVAVARIQQNAHWTSDVVAGSAIGWAVGSAVVHRHSGPTGYSVVPWLGNGAGLMLTKDF